MHNVTPADEGAPLIRSVVACLASILELPRRDVPVPADAHPEPWTVWSQWLAVRGLGLVPIAEPATFNWPGPWLAVLEADEGGRVAAVAFGSPPGIASAPVDGPLDFSAVRFGYVIAPADVAQWRPVDKPATRHAGVVAAIAVAREAEEPMVLVEHAVAVAGRGLQGDRYFDGRGTFSNRNGLGYDLTLIEAEVLDDLPLPGGRLAPQDARRNIVTRGIDLNALVGRRFTIGDVECLGQRLCEPCAHLERLTTAQGAPGTLRALVHRGGLRADVLSDGRIDLGTPVRAISA